jgi:hypothetical protein
MSLKVFENEVECFVANSLEEAIGFAVERAQYGSVEEYLKDYPIEEWKEISAEDFIKRTYDRDDPSISKGWLCDK